MPLPDRPFPKPTAQVEPFCDVLGPDLTVTFLLTFGGAELVYPDNPCGRSRLEALVGTERTRALGAIAHKLPRRVALANPWLAAMLRWLKQQEAKGR